MAVVLLVIFLLVGLLLMLSNKEKFLVYFFFLYPILPEYFAVSISDSFPLFTASRLLFLMLLVAYLLKAKKIRYGILKDEGLWNSFLLLIVGYISIDNEYLNWFVSFGLIGFICYFNWYRAIIFNLKRKLVRVGNKDLNSLYYGLIAIMLCYFAVDQLTTNRIFNSLLVLLISGIKIYQDKREGEIEIEYE